MLGGVADRIGRRPTILGCLAVMATGMVMATTASGLAALSTWRIVTGLGIGGMLAAINAVSMEFSNTRRRHLSVSLMSIGYPLGAVFGGMVAARLLQGNDWRTVFYFGAGVTAVLIPLVFFFVPESVHWLVTQAAGRRAGAGQSLAGADAATRRSTALPEIARRRRATGRSQTSSPPQQLAGTVIVTLAYFLHITTFYFIVKWVPKIVVDLGFAASAAAGVLVWTNVGGAIGGAVLGLLTQRFSVKTLTIGVLLASTVAVTAFGRTPADLQRLSIICGVSRLLHQRGDRRPLRDHRAGLPHAHSRDRHRLHDRRRPRRFGVRADHRGVPVRRPATRCRPWRSYSGSDRSSPGRAPVPEARTRSAGGRTVGRPNHCYTHSRGRPRAVGGVMRSLRSGAALTAFAAAGLFVWASGAFAQAPSGRGAEAAATRPPLVFKEDWRLPPHEGAPTDENMRFTPAVVKTDAIEAKLYGTTASMIRAAEHEGRIDFWTGLATSPVAVTLRDKRNYVDLTGLARLRWLVRTSSIHTLYPVVKLADGTYIAGNRGISTDGEFLQVEVVFAGMRWYKLDPVKVVVTSEVKNPDLSKVDEVGLVTLAPGGGHGVAGFGEPVHG